MKLWRRFLAWLRECAVRCEFKSCENSGEAVKIAEDWFGTDLYERRCKAHLPD